MDPPPVRQSIIDALDLAASAERQVRYEADVPIAQVVAEIFCAWDDAYMPESEWWARAFDERERVALTAYERENTRIAGAIPNHYHDVASFQALAESKELAAAARRALAALGACR